MEPAGKTEPTSTEHRADEGGSDNAGKRGYEADGRYSFCPQKELNLPSSYDEVLARFKRLQAGKAMESLN
jgi:hypothetical protein